MGLFRKMNDIVTANLHEMVDRFENPQTMLKQAIREMEQALSQSLDSAAVVASEKLLESQLAEQSRQAQRWHSRAEAAIASGSDEQARDALLRKYECRNVVATLRDERETLGAASAELADA